jgi:putative spermidine/putrescine transport system permease protein
MSEGTKRSTVIHDEIHGGTGRKTSASRLVSLLGPALSLILLLFGGGLILGLLQALDQSSSQNVAAIGLQHFAHVLQDPDFGKSLILTLYLSITSTLIAAVVSVVLALTLIQWAADSRAVNFILQVPLTVPHLVIAISVILLLAPSGLFSRLLSTLSIIQSPSAFPLLINDGWGIGIITVYIWKEIPFITFMLLSVLKNMGTELLDVGSTLKATRFQRFSFITLPIIAPSLSAACLIVFAFTFGAFEVPFLLGRTYPLALSVWAYKNYSDIDLMARPEGIAIGLIIASIVILAIILSQVVLHFGRKRGLTI